MCWTSRSPISRNCVNTSARSPWSSNSVTSSSNRVSLPDRPARRDPSLSACAGWLQICLSRISAASTSPRRRMPLDSSASARSWSTTCWYIVACSRVSLAYAICSILSGRSGRRRRSALVRRRMNGCVSRRSRAAASASPLRSIGVPNRDRNFCSPPSRPGLTASRIAHSSLRRFSTGVPVSASFWPARRWRTARAALVFGFFTICASSSTTVDHSIAPRCSRSRGSSPYVVITSCRSGSLANSVSAAIPDRGRCRRSTCCGCCRGGSAPRAWG